MQTKADAEIAPNEIVSEEKNDTPQLPLPAAVAEAFHDSPESLHVAPTLATELTDAHNSAESLLSKRSSLGTAVMVSPAGVGDEDDGHVVSEKLPSPADVVLSEPTPELDTTLYVGTATWEERTWRELVKLREEMFWARLGGIR